VLAFVFFIAAAPPATGAPMVGAERCQSCHPQAYKVWSQSAHARALDTLGEQQRKQTRCTLCHTMSPEQVEAQLANVQCESCHGGGKYYVPSYVMKDKVLAHAVGLIDPGEATCKRCHDQNAPSLEPFDYKKAWARIAHGKD
jgi:hypothetical protein